MTFAIKRTGDADYPRHMKILIMGPPKSGKTTFISTAPNVVVADVEAGLMSIAHLNVPYVTIDEVSKIETLYQILKDDGLRQRAAVSMGLPDIQTVAIDTLDAFQEMLKRDILATERRTSMQQADWGKLKERMYAMLKAFKELPLNVIFTVHTSTSQDEDGRQILTPGLQGSIKDEIAGLVDFSLMSAREQQVLPDGTSVVKYFLKNEGDTKNPHLGNRGAGRVPEITDMDFQVLHDATFSGIKSLPKSQTFDVESIQSQAGAQVPAVGEAAQIPSQPEVVKVADDAQAPLNAAGKSVLTKSYEAMGLNQPELKGWTMEKGRDVARKFTNAKSAAVTGDPETAKTELIEWLKENDAFVGLLGEEPPEVVAEVTSEPAETDEDEKALAVVEESLGGQVVFEKVEEGALCDVCKEKIDDVEIGNLSKSRYGKVLCVKDYMSETKK